MAIRKKFLKIEKCLYYPIPGSTPWSAARSMQQLHIKTLECSSVSMQQTADTAPAVSTAGLVQDSISSSQTVFRLHYDRGAVAGGLVGVSCSHQSKSGSCSPNPSSGCCWLVLCCCGIQEAELRSCLAIAHTCAAAACRRPQPITAQSWGRRTNERGRRAA